MYATCDDCEMVYDACDPRREADHWAWHEKAFVGWPVPSDAMPDVRAAAQQIAGGLRIVHAVAGGNDVLRHLAWDASMFAAHMDGSKTMFDGGTHDVDAQARAILAIADTPSTSETGLHVVGVVITRRKEYRVRARWQPAYIVDGRVMVDEENPESMRCCEPTGSRDSILDPAWSIDHVWTHRAHRRRGIARMLVDAAIRTHDLDVAAGLTWMHPFLSTAGASLAYRYSDGEFWLS